MHTKGAKHARHLTRRGEQLRSSDRFSQPSERSLNGPRSTARRQPRALPFTKAIAAFLDSCAFSATICIHQSLEYATTAQFRDLLFQESMAAFGPWLADRVLDRLSRSMMASHAVTQHDTHLSQARPTDSNQAMPTILMYFRDLPMDMRWHWTLAKDGPGKDALSLTLLRHHKLNASAVDTK